MAIKVLVVDDSSFFRRRVSEILNADARLEVIDTANNGKEGVEKALRLHPDVITMDIEMPVMDGITAVREIMKQRPVPILMFSSLTHEGAQATLDALDAGALDFIPKKFEDIARDREEAVTLLQKRVVELSRKRVGLRSARPAAEPQRESMSRPAASVTTRSTLATANRPATPAVAPALRYRASGKNYQLVAIGTSTGGPVALQKILTQLPRNFPLPIVLVQHMPGTFTNAFASRLNNLCQIEVKEAQDGDLLRPGVAYLAPGGLQMMLDGRAGSARLKVLDAGDKMNYKPCVDVTFGSAAKVFGGKVLSMILTGMGADGREGARMLKQAGATIWAQDEESCVVYGMPQAIAKAGISSEDLPIDRIAERIKVELGIA